MTQSLKQVSDLLQQKIGNPFERPASKLQFTSSVALPFIFFCLFQTKDFGFFLNKRLFFLLGGDSKVKERTKQSELELSICSHYREETGFVSCKMHTGVLQLMQTMCLVVSCKRHTGVLQLMQTMCLEPEIISLAWISNAVIGRYI